MIGQPFIRTLAPLVEQSTTRFKVSHCEKLKSYLTIPQFSLPRLDWIGASVICCQLNYTLPWTFRLSGWKSLSAVDPALNFSICIRYRIGHTVYRYRLFQAPGETSLYVPDYAGELIYPHFSLECWSSFIYNTLIIPETLSLRLNRLYYPASCHDFSSVNYTNATFCDDELYINAVGGVFAIPNAFSICSAWHSNGSSITADSTSITADSTVITADDEG